MSILFAGTSNADVTIVGGVPVNAATAAQRAANCSEAISVNNSMKARILHATKMDFWLSFYLYQGNDTDTVDPIYMYDLDYDTANPVFRWSMDTNGQQFIQLEAWTGTTWVDVVSTSSVFTLNALHRVDIHTVIGDTGSIEVYVDGASAASYSGDTFLAAIAGINCIDLMSFDSTDNVHYSAIIVADEDTRGMTFIQRKPSANGSNTSWSNDYASVDEVSYSDADFQRALLDGNTQTYTKAALPTAYNTGYDVLAAIVSARSRVGAGGKMKAAFNVVGTTYQGSDMGGSDVYGPAQSVEALNPATSAAWSFAEIDGAEFGMSLVANP